MSPRVNNGQPLSDGALRYIASSEGGDQRDSAFAKVHSLTHSRHACPHARSMSMRYRGFQVEQFHRPSVKFQCEDLVRIVIPMDSPLEALGE